MTISTPLIIVNLAWFSWSDLADGRVLWLGLDEFLGDELWLVHSLLQWAERSGAFFWHHNGSWNNIAVV
jgi:hypothetical protein